MSPIKVMVHGALGRMGQTVLAALAQDGETAPVAGVDNPAPSDRVQVPGTDTHVPLAATLDPLLEQTRPDVLVDFSVASATVPAVRRGAERGVSFVVGTTGLTPQDIEELRGLAARHEVGGVVASNFALGAVLMMHLAQKAASYFDHAEIIETHHEGKIDAPSGTALTTARLMAEARGRPFRRNVPEKETLAATRSGELEGVTIHSVRLPGAMAHHEVIFGTAGQTLSIRHDTINRDCYVPGILMAVKHVVKQKGFIFGLDKLLGL